MITNHASVNWNAKVVEIAKKSRINKKILHQDFILTN